jgi:hypothetical protein
MMEKRSYNGFKNGIRKYIQGVFEIRVLILTSRRTLQFMKLFSIIFLRKNITKK